MRYLAGMRCIRTHSIPQTHDILVGPEKPEDHKTRRYINSVIGRYTNRLPVKPLQFERKGIKGEFTPIPNGAS